LFEVVSQALLSAINRDAFSGWGAEVHIMYAPSSTLFFCFLSYTLPIYQHTKGGHCARDKSPHGLKLLYAAL